MTTRDDSERGRSDRRNEHSRDRASPQRATAREEETGEGTRDYGRLEGTATEGPASPRATEAAQQPASEGAETHDAHERPASESVEPGTAGGYGPPDTRAADDTLGGYGGVAGGKDLRPEQQRKRERPADDKD